MSWHSSSSDNPQVENATTNATLNDQYADQPSSYKSLYMEVLGRVSHSCVHSYSMVELKRWTNSWNEKICLLWLVNEGKDWPDIIEWFEDKDLKKKKKAFYSQWTRASNEINAMQGAAEQYMELCRIAGILEVEVPDPWNSISTSMEGCGAKENWSPAKVKYAWHHGASTLLRNVTIVCKND